MALKRIDTNPIVESVARKNKKFRKYLELKRKGKIIRTQPRLPGLKKGKSVTIKPVGMVFKVEKKLAGGLAGMAIRGAVRSEPGKNLFKGISKRLKKMYSKRLKSSETPKSDKKMLKGLLKLDIKRTKTDVLKDMMKFLYTQGKGAPKGSGARKGAASGLRSFRKLQKYDKNLRKQGSAILERKGKNIKLNSKGGIQNVANKLKKASKAHAAQAVTLEKIAKKSTGGMADYYKDIL